MRRDPASQFWRVILAEGVGVLLSGIGWLASVRGETTDAERWVGIGLIGSGVLISGVAMGGFANLFFELRSSERAPAAATKANVSFQPDITMGLALLRVRNDGPSTTVQIQVEGIQGVAPADKIYKQLLKFPYTAPWMSASDNVRTANWAERRERVLLNGASQTVGLMTAWGERIQIWGTDFYDGHVWAISQARRRDRIKFDIAILGDGFRRRDTIEFRRTATGLTLPTDQKRARTGASS